MDDPRRPAVLIVDDNSRNLQVLADILRSRRFRVGMAKDGFKALEFMRRVTPDIILLDVMMPEMDGYEVCRRIKADPDVRPVPVIFISALNAAEDKVKGFQAGGVDYIAKPFHREEVLARVDTHIELKRAREDLEAAYAAVKDANRKLEIAARTDSLTRISNRRDIIEKIEYESVRSRRSGKPFSLILADIDNFKMVNDAYGHDCGDYVLVGVSDTIRSRLRKQDIVSRWGGEEFLLLLPETEAAGARKAAGVIRKALSDKPFEYEARRLTVTMTYGVSSYAAGNSIDDCIKKADEALYKGKSMGKDCIVVSPD